MTASRQRAGGRSSARAAAAVSIVSNTPLIALKSSPACSPARSRSSPRRSTRRSTCAASFIAFFSVRQAEEPADAEHRYGHEKFENVAAAAEGVLILVGSGVIVFAAIRSADPGPGARVASASASSSIGFATRRQPGRLELAVPQRARDVAVAGAGGRRGAPAHRRLHVARRARRPRAGRSHRRGVARPGRRARDRRRDRRHRPADHRRARWRVLVDEALPDDELAAIRDAIEAFAGRGVVGYHQLRTRRAGRAPLRRPARAVRVTAPRSRRRTARRTSCRTRSSAGCPAARRADPPRARGPRAAGRGAARYRRLIAAASATASTTPA